MRRSVLKAEFRISEFISTIASFNKVSNPRLGYEI